jgi:type II secretory pathway component PulF
MVTLREFEYVAANAKGGKQVKGTLEAASEVAAASKLRAQGLTPVSINVANKSGLNMEIRIPGFEKKVKTKSLAVFSRQFAALTEAGLPLMRALQLVVDQTTDAPLRKALDQVVIDVEGGQPLSTAFGAHPKVFPPLFTAIVRVGETGGFLGQSLDSVATIYEKEVELRGKVKSALTYPGVVAGVALVAVLGMVTFIVPVFEKMFKSMDAQLPTPTRVLVALSHNMIWILPTLVVVTFLFLVWWNANKHKEFVRKVKDPFMMRLPVFGNLINKVAVARFARSVAMMVNAGVPLLQALQIVRDAADNWPLEQAIDDINDSMRQGRTFAGPLAAHEVFPPLVAQMVAIGEESGSLGDMLDNVADYYEKEIDRTAESLSSAIEPIMILFLGVLIGGMVVALYLPMFGMMDLMSKDAGGG